MTSFQTWPGKPHPLGATWDGEGVNFALFSANAAGVELCLFDETGEQEIARIPVEEKTNQIWHIYLPGIGPGQRYGYRVSGPYEPHHGHRFNPQKLLLDPYAKAISGPIRWDDALYGYTVGSYRADLSFDRRDSAPFMPKSVVVDPAFDWEGDAPPRIPLDRTVIYETHVKGLTIRHPAVPEPLRGTYAGLASPPMLEYLRSLGVTAVELLPVHQAVSDRHLQESGLGNYWGYNSIGFFAPDGRYSASGTDGGQVREFREMVKALHREGIEVILDVVYNHTGEGNHLGPTLCFRGIDNAAYYRLEPEDRRYYRDYTATGNTLNVMQPHVLQLIMDSLRYWVQDMHVDGFRFDLAPALGREHHDFDPYGSFFDAVRQDPVLSQVKLIAEPWDIGEGGYQVGRFPPGWSEWNDRYRDAMRDFWRGALNRPGEFAARLTGSADLFASSGRGPAASINYITAHDGFTLRDLVSYERKHNEANLEGSRDGSNDNRSANYGVEGPSRSPAINQIRARQVRNLLATLVVSQGVPMLLGGDEIGRTQRGNNNAYNQDNEISWYDWNQADLDLLAFTHQLIRFRLKHPVFHRRKWLLGQAAGPDELKDSGWFTPDGREMDAGDWGREDLRSLAVYLNGNSLPYRGERGEEIRDNSFLILFNTDPSPVTFTLPGPEWGACWAKEIDTCYDAVGAFSQQFPAGGTVELDGRSLVVLRQAG